MSQSKRWRRPQLVNIYLMQVGDSDIYKIGYTSNAPSLRVSALKQYIEDIKLIDFVLCDFKFEKMFHERFKQQKRQQNVIGFHEFFQLNKSDVDFIIYFFNRKRNGKATS